MRPERILPDQQDLQRRPNVERGTDQQPQVGERLGAEQMGFVEDQQQRAVGARGSFRGSVRRADPCRAGELAQLRHDQLQQAGGRQLGEMAVDGLALLRQQAMQEPFQERGLADAAGTGDQPQLAVAQKYSKRAKPSSIRVSCQRAATVACSEKGCREN